MNNGIRDVRQWALFLHKEDDVGSVPYQSSYGLREIPLVTFSQMKMCRMDPARKDEFTNNRDIVQDSA
jgi:hypothetical protein